MPEVGGRCLGGETFSLRREQVATCPGGSRATPPWRLRMPGSSRLRPSSSRSRYHLIEPVKIFPSAGGSPWTTKIVSPGGSLPPGRGAQAVKIPIQILWLKVVDSRNIKEQEENRWQGVVLGMFQGVARRLDGGVFRAEGHVVGPTSTAPWPFGNGSLTESTVSLVRFRSKCEGRREAPHDLAEARRERLPVEGATETPALSAG